MRKILIVWAACLVLAGCDTVSKSKYDELKESCNAMATEIAILETEKDSLEQNNEELLNDNIELSMIIADAFDMPEDEEDESSSKPTINLANDYVGDMINYRFHLGACEYLPSKGNRIHYLDRDDAINDGFQPCRICNP